MQGQGRLGPTIRETWKDRSQLTGRQALLKTPGLAGSRAVADTLSTTRDHGEISDPPNRDPERPGPPGRTFVRIGIF